MLDPLFKEVMLLAPLPPPSLLLKFPRETCSCLPCMPQIPAVSFRVPNKPALCLVPDSLQSPSPQSSFNYQPRYRLNLSTTSNPFLFFVFPCLFSALCCRLPYIWPSKRPGAHKSRGGFQCNHQKQKAF